MSVDSLINVGGKRDQLPSLVRFMVSEMIKPAIKPPSGGYFSGGSGEAQFSSFLLDEYSDRVAKQLDVFKGGNHG